jgi:hypothetical protein
LSAVPNKLLIDPSGQIIIIRKYQSPCRRLGRFIPVADPTPEYVIQLSDLKAEIRGDGSLSLLGPGRQPEHIQKLSHHQGGPAQLTAAVEIERHSLVRPMLVKVLLSELLTISTILHLPQFNLFLSPIYIVLGLMVTGTTSTYQLASAMHISGQE